MNWLLLKNSLLVGGLTTLLAASFGFVAALWLAGLEGRWRHRLLAVAVMALALPPFLVTNCWLHFLGLAGVWRGWLPLNIVSLGGTVWILSLLTWPITLLMVLSAWQRLEPSQLESDVAVSGWWLIRGLLWPLGRAALAQAAVLTFVLAMNNFAVPAILQVKVFPAEMWVRFNTTFDTLGALQLSWPLVVAPLLLLLWFARREFPWPRMEGPVSARLFRQQLGPGWFWFCGACTILLCLLAVGLPVFQLVSVKRTWTELPGALAAGQSALWNSFFLAAAAATAIIVFGLFAGTRRRAFRLSASASFGLRISDFGFLPLARLAALPPARGIAGHCADRAVQPALVRAPLSKRRDCHPGVCDPIPGVGLELAGPRLASGGPRFDRRRAAGRRDALADAALCAVAADRPASRRRVVYRLPALPLGRGVNDSGRAARGRDPGAARVQPAALRPQRAGERAVPDAAGVGGGAAGGVEGVVRGAWCVFSTHATRNTQHAPGSPAPLRSLSPAAPPARPPTRRRLQSQLFQRVQIIGSRGVGVGQLNKPRSVAVDTQDNLYVVDMTGRVQKFSSNGVFLLSWQMPQTDLGKPKGMCRDRDGNIIVLEPHYQRVNVFSPEGKLLAQWGKRGTNAGEFMLPRAVAVNSRGEVFVSEYGVLERVQRFTARGEKLLAGFGHSGTGPGEFNRPEGLCVDAQDRLYVADSCNHRIQVFSSDGKFLRAYGKAGKGKGELSYPYDICVDAAGRQYVCEFGNSRIQVFDANDQPLEIIGGPGLAPGQFNNPWGVALDSAGNLYVADSQNHRVQKLIR